MFRYLSVGVLSRFRYPAHNPIDGNGLGRVKRGGHRCAETDLHSIVARWFATDHRDVARQMAQLIE